MYACDCINRTEKCVVDVEYFLFHSFICPWKILAKVDKREKRQKFPPFFVLQNSSFGVGKLFLFLFSFSTRKKIIHLPLAFLSIIYKMAKDRFSYLPILNYLVVWINYGYESVNICRMCERARAPTIVYRVFRNSPLFIPFCLSLSTVNS